MTHFAVLVIGENPEEQLAPFHEFECTGIDDQWVQDIDITEEALTQMATYSDMSIEEKIDHIYGYPTINCNIFNSQSLPESCKYGYAVIDFDGSLIKVITRTNPDARWDYYNSYYGYIYVKDESKYAQTYKKHIKLTKFFTTRCPVAIVNNGRWIERASMGSFGSSKELISPDEWNKFFRKIIKSLPDDTLISAFDCHI